MTDASNTEGEGAAVVVKHCPSTVKNADRVYVPDEGRAIEAGSYHELRSCTLKVLLRFAQGAV